MASRQWEWQKRKLALGRCMICGKARAKGNRNYCPKHRDIHAARERQRRFAQRQAS